MRLRAKIVGGWFAAGRMVGASVARRWDGWDHGSWIEGVWGTSISRARYRNFDAILESHQQLYQGMAKFGTVSR
jgi:hypothetical protein